MPTWAAEDEFLQFLVASGLTALTPTEAQGLLDLAGALDAAEEEWNGETRYWPFLSTGVTTEERAFDPRPSRYIDLNGGLLTLTSLKTGVTYSNPTGTTRVTTQDYVMDPTDAVQQGKPWTRVLVNWNQGADVGGGYPGSIRVTGEWGYTTAANLKEDARRAHMAMAARQLMPQIQMVLRKGGLKRHRQGDSEKEWGGVEEVGKLWDGMISRAVLKYRRLRVA